MSTTLMPRSFLCCLLLLGITAQARAQIPALSAGFQKQAAVLLRPIIMGEAALALKEEPLTVTARYSPRSAGGRHDFFSEGDYWWPNPASADSPYVQRDGMTNPDNFTAHRMAMIRFSRIMGALASAYLLTGDGKYAAQAFRHCRAWFVDTSTMMNPHLLYAQAIKGRFTGRGIGIIDAIQLMEVSQALIIFEESRHADAAVISKSKEWFASYLQWVSTHRYGLAEMNAENNHGTCWVMQVAAFAQYTGNKALSEFCRDRFRKILLPGQMAADGSFPRELSRTKPYGYALFNLDAMVMICQILSTKTDNLFLYKTADGKSVQAGIRYMYPFIADKKSWPLKKDVMHWDDWPVAQPALIFGAEAYKNKDWFLTWQKLDHKPAVEEVIRNLPVRHPLIWFK